MKRQKAKMACAHLARAVDNLVQDLGGVRLQHEAHLDFVQPGLGVVEADRLDADVGGIRPQHLLERVRHLYRQCIRQDFH